MMPSMCLFRTSPGYTSSLEVLTSLVGMQVDSRGSSSFRISQIQVTCHPAADPGHARSLGPVCFPCGSVKKVSQALEALQRHAATNSRPSLHLRGGSVQEGLQRYRLAACKPDHPVRAAEQGFDFLPVGRRLVALRALVITDSSPTESYSAEWT